MPKERLIEMAMVDIAYLILEDKGEPLNYRELIDAVGKEKDFTEADIEKFISQLFTEINIDGRFVCVGRSLWGLREWYPTEQSTDSAVQANVKDDYLDDELEADLFEEDEVYEEDITEVELTDTFEEDDEEDDDTADLTDVDDDLVAVDDDEEDDLTDDEDEEDPEVD